MNVLDDKALASAYVGWCYAYAQDSPGGFEDLWFVPSPPTPAIPTAVAENNIVPVIGGKCSFVNLYFNKADNYPYIVRFILLDSTRTGAAFVDSAPFTVSVGSIYKIAISKYPGAVTGGKPFPDQPEISLYDRGDNTVTTYRGSSTVAVSLDVNPLLPARLTSTLGSLTANFFYGVAVFNGLNIDLAGGPYYLTFVITPDIPIAGATVVKTKPFTVGIGPPARMVFVDQVSKGTAIGGLAFSHQPSMFVVDAGGNKLADDSSSKVVASIYSNPSAGTLSPKEYLSTQLVKGVANFNNLRIDKAGLGYNLVYTLIVVKTTKSNVVNPTVTLIGQPFDVVPGVTSKITVATLPGGAWAGGQPFSIQPSINLVDFGGNLVKTDSNTVVTSTIVPSLAVNYDVIVTTSTSCTNIITTICSPTVTVSSIAFSSATLAKAALGSLGPGDTVQVVVTFAHEVKPSYPAVVGNAAPSTNRPYLELNFDDTTPNIPVAKARAVLVSTFVGDGSDADRSRTLTFEYVINKLDTVGVAPNAVPTLSYSVPTAPAKALNAGSSASAALPWTIKDNLNRDADLTLPNPSPLLASGISVDPAQPTVRSIFVDEYSKTPVRTEPDFGSGEAITFYVEFDRPVTAIGNPQLPLSFAAPAPGGVAMASPTRLISVFRGSGTKTLGFLYIVQPGDSSANLDVPNPGSITASSLTASTLNVIVYASHDAMKSSTVRNAALLVDVDYRLQTNALVPVQVLLALANPIVIDTAAPELDYNYLIPTKNVRSFLEADISGGAGTIEDPFRPRTSDTTYSPGDVLYFIVHFTKKVKVSTDFTLYLNTVNVATTTPTEYYGSATYDGGTGTKNIRYELAKSSTPSKPLSVRRTSSAQATRITHRTPARFAFCSSLLFVPLGSLNSPG